MMASAIPDAEKMRTLDKVEQHLRYIADQLHTVSSLFRSNISAEQLHPSLVVLDQAVHQAWKDLQEGNHDP